MEKYDTQLPGTYMRVIFFPEIDVYVSASSAKGPCWAVGSELNSWKRVIEHKAAEKSYGVIRIGFEGNPFTFVTAGSNWVAHIDIAQIHKQQSPRMLSYVEIKDENHLYAIEKLSGELFAIYMERLRSIGFFKLVESKKIVEIKRLRIQESSSTWLHWLRKSKLFGECFYVNSDDHQLAIQKINYETFKVEQRYTEKNEDDIMTLDCFVKGGLEYVVGGGKIGGFAVYESVSGDLIFFGNDESKPESGKWMFSLFVLNEKYLLVGRADSSVDIWEIEGKRNFEKCTKKAILGDLCHENRRSWVMDFAVMKQTQTDVQLMVMLEYGKISTISIKGLQMTNEEEEKQAKVDLRERTEFLSDAQDLFVFDGILISRLIRLKNSEFEIFCSFLI